MVDSRGTALAFCLSGANTNDSLLFETLVDAISNERLIGALKHYRWVATQHDQTARNYLAFV